MHRLKSVICVVPLLVVIVLVIGIARSRLAQRARSSMQLIEPGVTLTSVQETRATGPLQMFVLRVETQSGWRLRVAPAAYSVLKRTRVSQMTAQQGALAGVNGGYFAYEGAAVGAVKIDGEWLRLPWKNRTAIGLRPDGTAKIDNLQATATVEFSGGQRVVLANLNGRPVANAICLMTPRFATTIKLHEDEIALEIENGAVVARTATGEAAIRANGSTLVASGEARAQLEGIEVGAKSVLKIETTPAAWQEYPTILGAGPRLLRAGKVETTEVEEEFRPDVIHRGRRTAIGIDANGDFLLVVVDVAPELSIGMTIPELATELQKLGALEAINLDGGGSVALVVKDQLINSRVKEPVVANAVLVVKQVTGAAEK